MSVRESTVSGNIVRAKYLPPGGAYSNGIHIEWGSTGADLVDRVSGIRVDLNNIIHPSSTGCTGANRPLTKRDVEMWEDLQAREEELQRQRQEQAELEYRQLQERSNGTNSTEPTNPPPPPPTTNPPPPPPATTAPP